MNYSSITPRVGQLVKFTIFGFLLDSIPGHDSIKTVKATEDCTAAASGADREGKNLGPGDKDGLPYTDWDTTFLLPGSYKICYRVFGGNYVHIGTNFSVSDNRPRPPPSPPKGLADASETNTAAWVDFRPHTITNNDSVTFTFYGFEVYGYGYPNGPEVEVKVVVEDCLESWPSVKGGQATRLGAHHTATFTLVQLGKYVMCVKHRREWEKLDPLLTVTTADTLELYYGFSSCEQYMRVYQSPSKCGCFYDTGTLPNELPINLAIDFPATELRKAQSSPLINQGCCVHNTVQRQHAADVNVNWGWCSQE
eukprot:NODE_236_length_2055_cov_99.832004_g202_i0.p1 GENE.NODE_236_length_2055_cov_99.832004_g202_i0~~NODE_236_length_2055_cov_99.832004_g202_i0.p1  ORF type:complete len:309 (+),score=85.36 NODE_236_length_2055_cov_99.832004_g202_i0:992-1918(+)